MLAVAEQSPRDQLIRLLAVGKGGLGVLQNSNPDKGKPARSELAEQRPGGRADDSFVCLPPNGKCQTCIAHRAVDGQAKRGPRRGKVNSPRRPLLRRGLVGAQVVAAGAGVKDATHAQRVVVPGGLLIGSSGATAPEPVCGARVTDRVEFVIDGVNLDCSIRESERDAGANCRRLNAWSLCGSLVSR